MSPIRLAALLVLLATAATLSCGSGESQTSSPKSEGGEGAPCYPNSTCNAGLLCLSKLCVNPGTGGSDGGGEDAGAGGSAGALPDAAHGTDTSADVMAEACASVGCPPGACGTVGDGCGALLQCGECSGYNSCGGGGTPNACGCTPKPAGQACGQAQCGTADDGCGGQVACGECNSVQECQGGQCVGCTQEDIGPVCPGTMPWSWVCDKGHAGKLDYLGCMSICTADGNAPDVMCCKFDSHNISGKKTVTYCPLGEYAPSGCDCFGADRPVCDGSPPICSAQVHGFSCEPEHTGACF